MASQTRAALRVEPMRDSNAPGWTLAADDLTYMLWAPRGPIDGFVNARPHWAACCVDEDGDRATQAEYRRGESFEAVAGVFPPRAVRAAFTAAAAGPLGSLDPAEPLTLTDLLAMVDAVPA